MNNTTDNNFDVLPGQYWIGNSGVEYKIVRVTRYGKPRWSYTVQYHAVNYPEYIYSANAFAFYNKHSKKI